MLSWLKLLSSKLVQYFSSDRARLDAESALKLAPRALPIISMILDAVTTLTPTGIDDVVWSGIKARYPSLFDGTVRTEEEIKLAALAAAADVLKGKFPGVSTTVARASVQLACIEHFSEDKGSK